LVIFNLQTAARRGDLLNLTWKGVHSDHVEFLHTKEGRMRSVMLSDNARTILATLRPPRIAENDFVFEPNVLRRTMESRIRREWNRATKKAGIPHIRYHDVRHTALTRMVVNGEDLETVRAIAGHASLRTTQRYLHSNDKLKQQAVEKLSEFGRYLPTAPENPLPENPVSVRIN
jgi:integrase